ncbi:MAG: T9SS type A sorting domain-containing protein, partial [Flavobacteriaceae bacterium]|nr:T9SS type A sorting domain-containing protein [Flavobacteriaceae bacterium]
RVSNSNRQKIESYLAIKCGITLGPANVAQKDYINSFDTVVWDISANTGYNYDVAGIGKDSISDLNQKQSKTLNSINGVTIGLGGIYTTNSANPNEFEDDGDFLVWGNNNAALSGTNSNTISIASGITTSVIRMDRKWKIVENTEVAGGDIETVFVGIPTTAFSAFSKTANEEYALIIADNPTFANGNIIDVIPLAINTDSQTGNPILDQNGNEIYKTWYNFNGTKYFTFGKVPRFSENHSITINSGDYLVGEVPMNLNADSFAVSAWVKCSPSANTRTIMAKGSKLQLRLNTSSQVEVTLDDLASAKFTSNTAITDDYWHQITFVYKSGTIFLYIDGVLDHTENDVVAPSPNFNHFSVGAVYDDKNTIFNPFLGEIDEIYIWNQALTEEQVKYLMNQEVERFDVSGTDYVTGKVIPYNVASNGVASIPWSDLEVYYNFNSFYGSTVEGLSDSRQFLRLKHLDKDKMLLTDQTAPLPYVTLADGVWDDSATWSNSTDQRIPNSLSLDGFTMIDWNIVDLNHNISSGDRDIYVLGLKNNMGTLTIADPNENLDEANSGQALNVTHYLEIDGVIDLIGESQLVQTEGSILDNDSGGYIERDQQGTANGFNYNYWSSSVGPISGNTTTRGTGISSSNTVHTISGVLLDGTNSAVYQNLIFSPYQDAANSSSTTPRTVSTYWMYKFYGEVDNYNAWESIDETSSLLPGEGYTMKGTSGAADILNDFQNYVFKGKPNNGDITLTLDKSTGDVQRLIGNPYPSAIDATEFILDNMSIADGGNNETGTIFNGALYFWDHFGEENSHNLSDYVGGYATRNLTGGVAAISDDNLINNTSNNGGPAIGTKVPGPYIPVNQGFLVSTALDGFNNDQGVPISNVDGGNIVFKNSQRVFARESTENSVFMRSVEDNSSNTYFDDTKRIRLMYDSPKGYHRQILLGKNQNTTNGFDLGYDAFIADINEEDMYWIFDGGKFVIQSVNNFDIIQEFPIGIIINESGLARIKVDTLENIDSSLTIHIRDNYTNQTHHINEDPFEIYLEAGTYEDRFELVFQEQTMSVSDKTKLEKEITVYYDSNFAEVRINNKNNIQIFGISLYNTLGQRILELDHLSNNISLSNVNLGVYILYLNTEKGPLSKKILIN